MNTNSLLAPITGNPRREERWDYPMDAMREIVINMIVHRDYRSSNDSTIKIFDDRIEFFNPGDCIMRSEHFDLNGILHEPTDAQLKTLMDSVVTETNRRAELARAALMQRLRDDIIAANRPRITT